MREEAMRLGGGRNLTTSRRRLASLSASLSPAPCTPTLATQERRPNSLTLLHHLFFLATSFAPLVTQATQVWLSHPAIRRRPLTLLLQGYPTYPTSPQDEARQSLYAAGQRIATRLFSPSSAGSQQGHQGLAAALSLRHSLPPPRHDVQRRCQPVLAQLRQRNVCW